MALTEENTVEITSDVKNQPEYMLYCMRVVKIKWEKAVLIVQ